MYIRLRSCSSNVQNSNKCASCKGMETVGKKCCEIIISVIEIHTQCLYYV